MHPRDLLDQIDGTEHWSHTTPDGELGKALQERHIY